MARKTPTEIKAKIAPDHPFHDLIQDAYKAFRDRRPSGLGVCENCCMEPEIEVDFFTPPVAALPLHYVRDWYSAAYDPTGVPKQTWGYLLPRILEILAAQEGPASVGLEVTLQRFETGNPAHWSAAEWDVLDRFQRMFLQRELETATEHYLDDSLCMFALAGWRLEDLLEQVLAAPDHVLAERFWRDWCQYGYGGRSIWTTVFWETLNRRRMLEFYTSQALYDRMARLGLADGTEPGIAGRALAVAYAIEAAGGPIQAEPPE